MTTHWIEYNKLTGEIMASGHTSGELPTPAYGGNVIKVDFFVDIFNSKYDFSEKKIISHKNKNNADANVLRFRIISDLARTDHTQGLDAIDHMETEKITQWREYRKTLRRAYKENNIDNILSILPIAPDNVDFYAQFRASDQE